MIFNEIYNEKFINIKYWFKYYVSNFISHDIVKLFLRDNKKSSNMHNENKLKTIKIQKQHYYKTMCQITVNLQHYKYMYVSNGIK